MNISASTDSAISSAARFHFRGREAYWQPKKVLIFRPGSLGDTVVALPCLHLIAQVFPEAERAVLTYSPLHVNYPAVKAVLGGSGLVNGFFETDYRVVRRSLLEQFQLLRRIRAWKPDILIYLTLPRRLRQLVLECTFFRLCGASRLIGVPLRKNLRTHRRIPQTDLYESEAERLARCIAELGDARPADPHSWNLGLSLGERESAARQIAAIRAESGFVGISVGAAMDANNWGVANWESLIAALDREYRGLAVVMVGGPDDFEPSARVSRDWSGPKLNLCGILSPRETAAMLERASVYIGHDSGPIHLAAAVGAPCVGIYGSRNPPGVWFPFGRQHKIIYHRVECSGCELKTCVVNKKKCILSITVDEVLAALRSIEWRDDFRGSARAGA